MESAMKINVDKQSNIKSQLNMHRRRENRAKKKKKKNAFENCMAFLAIG